MISPGSRRILVQARPADVSHSHVMGGRGGDTLRNIAGIGALPVQAVGPEGREVCLVTRRLLRGWLHGDWRIDAL